MADEKTQLWILGGISAMLAGLYGCFIRHIVGHVEKDQIDKLWQEKQSIQSCEQIVKRLDENHRVHCEKLDRILDHLEHGGSHHQGRP